MKNIKSFDEYTLNEGKFANIATGLLVSLLSILPHNLSAKSTNVNLNKTEINSEYLKYVYL